MRTQPDLSGRSAKKTSPAEVVFERLAGGHGAVYAVLDAARDSSGLDRAKASAGRCQSLYAGPGSDGLSQVAPHLVEFRSRSPFRRWWFEQWGRNFGVLVEAGARFDQLRRHLRTLMVVNTEDRKKCYFRFYDPRVLRVFLPACSGQDVARFFGPITAFYCEGAEGKELLTYLPGGDGVSVKQSPVGPEQLGTAARAGRASRTR